MNAILGSNVRDLRQIKHWTQQHLADTAGVLLRTVQRVEKGDGASLDTLGALANAFGVSIDFLQMDINGTLAEAMRELNATSETHLVVQVAPVRASSDLATLGGTHGNFMHCASPDDAVQDAFALLRSEVADMIDVWEDADPVSHREWLRSLYVQVQALERLGVTVSVGTGKYPHPSGVEIQTFYAVAWPRGEERAFIHIEKPAPAPRRQSASKG